MNLKIKIIAIAIATMGYIFAVPTTASSVENIDRLTMSPAADASKCRFTVTSKGWGANQYLHILMFGEPSFLNFNFNLRANAQGVVNYSNVVPRSEFARGSYVTLNAFLEDAGLGDIRPLTVKNSC